jgi:ribosomal protein L37AE/L43A
MLMSKACPRCRGDLARVDDVGDRYYSCVQCGHVIYGEVPQPAVAAATRGRSEWPVAASRADVRRNQIRKRNAQRRATHAA